MRGLCTATLTANLCDWCDLGERSFLRTLSEEHAVLALGALTDASGEFFDVIKDLTALGHLGQDLALGVHDGCVITAERLADFGQRKIGELTTQVHRNLS